jgi:hypothetical protein
MRFNVTRYVAAVAAALLVGAGIASAQAPQKTTTTETKKFTVIAVQGNQLDVRLPEGTRELTVPDDFRFNVNGQQMSVHELKPGMSGTAVISTTTTVKPVTVTEVKDGVVTKVMGSTIIVQTANGFQMLTQGEADTRGVKVVRDGQPVDFSQLHAGDRLTATIVSSRPPQIMTEKQVNATLDTPAKAAASAGKAVANAASATAAGAEKAGKATAAGATRAAKATGAALSGSGSSTGGASKAGGRKLPKTASPLPLVGLVGLTALSIGLGLTFRRQRVY